MTPESQVSAAAEMIVDVALAADAGDPRKAVAFAIDEFAVILGNQVHNIDELAAIIVEAVDKLRKRRGAE